MLYLIIENTRLYNIGGGAHMKFNSVFDIIGPVMIGPSSSHTAGAARIGKAARNLFGLELHGQRFTFMNPLRKRIKDTVQISL